MCELCRGSREDQVDEEPHNHRRDAGHNKPPQEGRCRGPGGEEGQRGLPGQDLPLLHGEGQGAEGGRRQQVGTLRWTARHDGPGWYDGSGWHDGPGRYDGPRDDGSPRLGSYDGRATSWPRFRACGRPWRPWWWRGGGRGEERSGE